MDDGAEGSSAAADSKRRRPIDVLYCCSGILTGMAVLVLLLLLLLLLAFRVSIEHRQDVGLEVLRDETTDTGMPETIVEELCLAADAPASHIYFCLERSMAPSFYLRFEVPDDESLERFRKHLLSLPVTELEITGQDVLCELPEDARKWWDECGSADEVYQWTWVVWEPPGTSPQFPRVIIDKSARRVFVAWEYD